MQAKEKSTPVIPALADQTGSLLRRHGAAMHYVDSRSCTIGTGRCNRMPCVRSCTAVPTPDFQGLDPEDKSEAGDAVIMVTCTACGRMHLVNPKSGETRKDKE